MSANRMTPSAQRCAGIALGGLLSSAVCAEVLPLPADGSDLVGQIEYVPARQEDTLIDIAREYSVGQDEIVMANPKVDRWLPGAGTRVTVPRQFILPDAPRNGIVVNIPEMRLYFYPVVGKGVKPTKVVTYPISIGRMDWRSPLGLTKVVAKVKDPVWRPPASIKAEHAKNGEILPDVVPAGPNNPLGQFAMRLGVPGYLIHGTDQDKSYGIGMRVTHGCIRMYPEDVAKLFPEVAVGTPVNLVNQPVKLGWQGETLYIEVSESLDEDRLSSADLMAKAVSLIQKETATHPVAIDEAALRKAVEEPTGIPTVISLSGAAPLEAAAPHSPAGGVEPGARDESQIEAPTMGGPAGPYGAEERPSTESLF
ncbi:L,D-transpeptidase family protein [Methylococcus capsulatus]|uniref:L,D-transpeptidase family protein n=1 Tax=Methylococcus capsulatus TaxID=414 RepID=UPI00211AFFF9|nr:L,D-transpeptidase family protein [Methylococcus capsulatus]